VLVLEAEVFHDRVFVKGHGARGHMEKVRDFLHRTAFREQLQHLALARGERFSTPGFTAWREEYIEGNYGLST